MSVKTSDEFKYDGPSKVLEVVFILMSGGVLLS